MEKQVHEQMQRLYQAAKLLKDLDGQTEIARVLNQSSQTINNWEARGISKPGMLAAQALIGCSATWLDTGEGRMVALGTLDEDEDELLLLYRKLDPRNRAALKTVARTFVGTAEQAPT